MKAFFSGLLASIMMLFSFSPESPDLSPNGIQGFEKPARILSLYQKALDDKNFSKQSTQYYYTHSRNNVTQTRKMSSNLKDSETGVIDAKGIYIRQEDSDYGLNCSGYAKWIADGYVYPVRKDFHTVLRYLSLKELKNKNLMLRGDSSSLKYENSKDPFFGLDWLRNIASCVEFEKNSRNVIWNYHDVTFSPSVPYVKDRGFPIEKLPLVLKEQTLMHPERWYFISINGPYGEDEILQHYHIAIIFSYFHIYKGKYVFRYHVFERNKETSFSYLQSRYPNTYCQLIWMDVDGIFELTLP